MNEKRIRNKAINDSSSTGFSLERNRDRTQKRQRPRTATFDDSTFRIRRTFRTETARVHFVRELSIRNRAPVIRTDETTIFPPAKRSHERRERSAAARAWGRNATGCVFQNERSSSVNTHSAPARPRCSRGAHPAPASPHLLRRRRRPRPKPAPAQKRSEGPRIQLQ